MQKEKQQNSNELDEEIHRNLSEHSFVLNCIKKEEQRSANNIELIASENFCSDAVRAACASVLTWKYAEGYPEGERHSGNRGRYYGGCKYIDELEEYCCDKWREVFNTDYHVNVQPHSGSQANCAAYMAVIKPGDTILSMSLSNGGHLTHGSPVNFSGRLYKIAEYGVTADGYIDYEDLYNKILSERPSVVLAGASAYPRIIDFAHIKDIIAKAVEIIGDSTYKPYFMVDMAHIAGLIASGDHPSPFGLADIITTTTHKTLRGTRGGLIFCKKELAKKIDSAVFPGTQGGGLQHIVAAKAVTAEEACTDEYKEYIHKVVKNCKAMCDRFIELGYDTITNGTDNHLLLIDFSKTHPNLSGKSVQDELDKHGITLNKNCVPNERRSPKETSGVRIGTAAMTTKGYTERDFVAVADMIDKIIKHMTEKEYE